MIKVTPEIIMWWYNTGKEAARKGCKFPMRVGVLLNCEIRYEAYVEGFRSVRHG